MKTRFMWLYDTLPTAIFHQATQNLMSEMGSQGETFLTEMCPNFYDAMWGAFTFSKTEQGFHYWADITYKYGKGENE